MDQKMIRSQQKCIVIFALVCCFAVLVALIFSAVDIWGEDEDGITEENCSKDCSLVLVENIPEDISFPGNGTSHLPLSVGLHNLLDQAMRVVEIVSPDWRLNCSDYESSFHPSAKQGMGLLSKLQELKTKRIQLRISSGIIKSTELDTLAKQNAEVHFVNMTALTKGNLSASFWVVDRTHFYIGSASMDWRSLATRKELGVLVYNCSCLALDLHKLFSLYWGLEYKEFIPSFWSKRLFAIFNRNAPLKLTLNKAKMTAYISSSPDVFIPKDRSSDLEAISRVIQEARRFIYISITDYLPLHANDAQRYWSGIDGLIREALILRRVRVRLLISCWEKTHPLTMNFIWSLKSLCMEQADCSLEAKFFNPRVQMDDSLEGINHNRFMVTDKAIYLGNLDWVGREFTFNAGAGLVISHPEDTEDRNFTVVEQLQAVFERDWFSSHSHPVQMDKTSVCSRHQVKSTSVNRLDKGPVPLRKSQYESKPAPMRTHPRADGDTEEKPRHHGIRQRKNNQQNMANGQLLVTDSCQERSRVKVIDERHPQIKENKLDNPTDPTSQSAESSGFRETSSGSQ